MLQIHLHCNGKSCAVILEKRGYGDYMVLFTICKKECHKICNGLKLLTFPYTRNLREINEAHLHAG